MNSILQTLNATPYPVENISWYWQPNTQYCWTEDIRHEMNGSDGRTANWTVFTPFYAFLEFDLSSDYHFSSSDSDNTDPRHWKALNQVIQDNLKDKWFINETKPQILYFTGGGPSSSPGLGFYLVFLSLTVISLWFMRRRNL